jgi:hypothetical protein
MSGHDFIKMKSYLASNLGHWFEIRWLGLLLPFRVVMADTEDGRSPWPVTREVQARPTGHQTHWQFFLRDLGDSVLLTFSDENKPQKADGGGAVWAVLNSSGGSFRWRVFSINLGCLFMSFFYNRHMCSCVSFLGSYIPMSSIFMPYLFLTDFH